MHHFNYRVIQSEFKGEPYFEVRSVWYNKNNEICSISTKSTEPIGDSLDELKAVFEKVMTAFEKPVLIEKEIKFSKRDPDELIDIESSETESEE